MDRGLGVSNIEVGLDQLGDFPWELYLRVATRDLLARHLLQVLHHGFNPSLPVSVSPYLEDRRSASHEQGEAGNVARVAVAGNRVASSFILPYDLQVPVRHLARADNTAAAVRRSSWAAGPERNG